MTIKHIHKTIHINEYLSNVFLHLFLGLFISGVMAFIGFKSGFILKIGFIGLILLGILGLILVVAQSFLIKNVQASALVYYLFSVVEGLSLAPIFYVYTGADISKAFIITALLFLVLYYIARNEILDLRSFGTYFFIFLIVGIIGSIVNLFLQSSLFDIILTWFLLIVFIGLTIYDLQALEDLAETKNPFFGALKLYLDLINLFLLILRLLVRREE